MISKLLDNNLSWAAGKTHDDPHYFLRLSEGQRPEYLWIGCSDSRVPANEVVGMQPGELFVHRNVANLAPIGDLNLMAVLQFAIESLEVRHIIVCGHYGCGGIRAAMDNAPQGPRSLASASAADLRGSSLGAPVHPRPGHARQSGGRTECARAGPLARTQPLCD